MILMKVLIKKECTATLTLTLKVTRIYLDDVFAPGSTLTA